MSSNPYEYKDKDSRAQEPLPDFSSDLRLGMQVVGASLILGVVFFQGLMLLLGGLKNEPVEAAGVLAWLGLGFAIVCLIASYVVPRVQNRGSATG